MENPNYKNLIDREVRIKREIEELFFKPVIVSVDDMDRFEKKRNEKNKTKNTCYDWLINYIPEPIRNIVVDFKYKLVSLFKTNTPKQTVWQRK